MESIGGSELIVPAHATVMMLGRSASDSGSLPADETITTGTGLSIVETPTSILSCFAIDYPSLDISGVTAVKLSCNSR